MYHNYIDNKIHMVFGEKGSGKTTLAAYIAMECNKRGIEVYTNTPIFGAFRITVDDMKKYQIPKNAVIIIDEAASEVNCRNWRDTTVDLLTILQQIRHYESTLYWITQSITALDNQITDLCEDAIHAVKRGNWTKYVVWHKYHDKRGKPIFIRPTSRLQNWMSHKIYRPKYYPYFDTHYIPPEMLERLMLPKSQW